jgi:hypothetical protein
MPQNMESGLCNIRSPTSLKFKKNSDELMNYGLLLLYHDRHGKGGFIA